MSHSNNNAVSPMPVMSSAAIEGLLAEVASQVRAQTAATGLAPIAPPVRKPFKEAAPESDPIASLLSPRQLRRARQHQEQFAAGLAARLSLLLRTEVVVKLSGLELAPYSRMTDSWPEPAHLTLFKTEPLRGVSILEIPISLGLSFVDRLMGGPGTPGDPAHEMSAIENALLEQVVQTVVTEWCSHFATIKELKPAILGYENNARFLQTAPPQATMFVVAFDTTLGRCQERIHLGFPFPALEPLLRQLAPETDLPETPAPAPAAAPAVLKWNKAFDEVRIPVAAGWQVLDVDARQLLNLKVGDVLKIDPQTAERIAVRLGESQKFEGRLGAIAGKWAVELTNIANH